MNELDATPIEDTAAASTAAPKPTLRRLFLGDDGLRAGWSLLLFLLIALVLGRLAAFVIAHWHLMPKGALQSASKAMTPKSTILSDGITFLSLAFVAWLMSLIEQRPFRRYGLTARHVIPDFLIGLIWGFVCLSLLIGILWLTHSLAFDGIALHGLAALVSGAKWGTAFLCVGLAEEFLTRGYIQYTVSRGVAGIVRAMDPTNEYAHAWGFWVAAFLFSICLFMLGHLGNPGETVPGILAVGVAGAVFAFSLWRTGSLWWAIGMHTSWDWCQSCLYGVHDSGIPAQGHIFSSHPIGSVLLSGGNTGPEGSIFVLPTLLLVAVIIHLTLPRRVYFLTPDQSALPQPSPSTNLGI